jgi:hypothetical protein
LSGHGGKREGAGRPSGATNKATDELRSLAREHTPDALATLASIMKASESDAARVSAANSLLDRGYGKPAQALVGGDEEDNPIRMVTEIRRSIVDPKEAA